MNAPPKTPEPASGSIPLPANFVFGWWSLLFYLLLGVFLESLHGFKIGWYLDVSNEVRRLMFTLAHTHGALLSILNIVFALSIRAILGGEQERAQLAGRCLLGATLLMPLGFLIGGVFIYGGDPGLGVLLVPPGALLLVLSVFLTARLAGRGAEADG